MTQITTGSRTIGDGSPTYFIADISANHDGDLERARMLIRLAARAGADAAKFQNFRAPEIVSDRGFRALGGKASHQASWKRPVYEVYQAASLPWEWTPELQEECHRAGIDYLSTPYDLEAVAMLNPHLALFKVGSGDITWPEMLHAVAATGKPVILATGASEMRDVERAMEVLAAHHVPVVLMQCNTNYTGSPENFDHIHLNVLRTYRLLYTDAILGLSDHTRGHAAVLGAVALGARVIEKHFTDDNSRDGPDHPFSMTPASWREMVDRTRELERALGSVQKRVEENEKETVILQRRCLRARHDLPAGTVLARDHLAVLRPAPPDSIPPYEIERVLGSRLRSGLPSGEHLRWELLEG
jgi:sialic acid synthase SpsE